MLATLVTSTGDSTMVLIVCLSLHLLCSSRNPTSPLPPSLPPFIIYLVIDVCFVQYLCCRSSSCLQLSAEHHWDYPYGLGRPCLLLPGYDPQRLWSWNSSSRKFTSPLLFSLSVAFFSLVLLVISLLMFYPLSCSLYWCTYRHSPTLMIKSEAIIDSISCCRVWQWEAWGGEQGKEGGGEKERGRNEDWDAWVIHK